MSRETAIGKDYLLTAKAANGLFREHCRKAHLSGPNLDRGHKLFARQLRNADVWMGRKATHLGGVITEMDDAIAVMNKPDDRDFADGMHPNLEAYWNLADRHELPAMDMLEDGKRQKLAKEMARRLFVGLSEPENPEGYAWYQLIEGDTGSGVAVTTLVDMYEIHTRVEGVYPESEAAGAIVSLAMTEAAAPNSRLLRTLATPGVNFIEGYDAFSLLFQMTYCTNLQ